MFHYNCSKALTKLMLANRRQQVFFDVKVFFCIDLRNALEKTSRNCINMLLYCIFWLFSEAQTNKNVRRNDGEERKKSIEANVITE